MNKKLLLNRTWLFMLFALMGGLGLSFAQTTYQIGTGTTTSSFDPIYTCYGYNYSQTIYTAAELNTAGASGSQIISKIRYYYNTGGTSFATWNDWVVYIGNTAQTAFASTTNWIPVGSMTQVYSGTITPVAATWMEITLTTPFIWDGTSNLVVAVDENAANYSCTASWGSYTGVGNRSILYYSDATNPDPASPPTANQAVNAALAQIQFVMAPNSACSGTPTAGTVNVPAGTTCSGNSVTLNTTGTTGGIGITYQWQEYNGSSWVNAVGGSGATTANYTTPVLATSTQYRLAVTCTNSGQTSYTPGATVNVGACCSYTFNMTDAFGDGWNGCAVQVKDGANVLATVTLASGSAGTQVVTVPSGITITLGAIVGSYSYEVGYTLVNNATGATIQTVAANSFPTANNPTFFTFTSSCAGCTGTPAPGNTLANTTSGTYSACVGATVNYTYSGSTPGTGLTYQWQSAPDISGVAGTYTNIGGANAATYSATTPATATWYRVLVTCSGNTGTAVGVKVSPGVNIGCYCNAIPPNAADEEIYSVTVNGATTPAAYAGAAGCTTVAPGVGSILGRYSNFTTLGNFTSMSPGSTVSFSIVEDECDGANYYAFGTAIWIDFNQNGSFTDAGEQVFVEATTATGPRTITGTFTVPAGATLGNTFMRIIVAEGYSGAGLTPCLAYGYGETEDFQVAIMAPCTTPTAVNASPTTVCPSGATTLTATSAGNTINWYTVATGGTSLGSSASGAGFSASPAATTTYYAEAVGATCGASARTAVTVTVADALPPTISWTGGAQSVNLGPACTVAMPNFTTSGSITKSDNCTATGSIVVTQSPSAGTTLSGTTPQTVTLIAADATGNTASTTFTLNKVDVTAPTISWTGGAQTVNLDASCAATVPNYTASGFITKGDACTASAGIIVTQSPAAGSPLSGTGATTITLTATDASNNTATTTFTLNRVDVTAPIISWTGGTQTVNLDASCAAVMPDYTASTSITKSDACGSTPTVTQSPAAGSPLSGVGSTTVTLTATDAANNTATTTFTLNRVDVTAPSVSWTGGTQTVNLDASCAAVMPDYTASTSITKSDACGSTPTITQSPAAGSALSGTGSTTVTLTATDAANNTATTTFTLNRVDVTAPSISWTGGTQTVNLDASCAAVMPDYTASTSITKSDACGSTPTVTQSPAAGSPLSGVGTTTVTLTATDASNNTATTTFDVNRVDVTAPTVTLPTTITANNDPGQCGAVVNFSIPGNDNCGGSVTVFASPASGSTFPIGTTTVIVTATDASNNSLPAPGFVTFDVVVTDNEVPVISSTPGSITTNNDAGACGAVVSWTAPSVSDNCAGSTITQTAGVTNGSLFPVGTTTVTYTANDANGNTATSSFTVTVNDNTPPVITPPVSAPTVTLNNMCQATVPDVVALSSATDNCMTGLTVTQSPVAGSPITSSPPFDIVITATDASMNSATATVTITPTTTTLNITPAGATTFCDGADVWLIAPVDPSYTYQWYKDSNMMPGAVADSALIDASGSYHVEVSIAGGCTMTANPITVTELPVPTAPVVTVTAPVGATSPVSICSGTPISLAYTGTTPAQEYIWYLNGTIVNYTLTPTATIASGGMLSGNNTLSLVAVYTGGAATCPSAPTDIIVVNNPLPVVTLSAAGGLPTTTAFCVNTPSTLTASSTTTASSYLWKRGGVTLPSTTSTYQPVLNGNHRVIVTDANGCVGQSPWTNVVVYQLPTANAGIDRNLCEGTSVQIGSTSNAANSYSWSPSTGLSSATISNPVTSATSNTTYTVTVTNNSTGCVNTDAMVLTSLARPATPSLAISGMTGASSATVCQGTNVVLVPTSTGTSNVWYKNNVAFTTQLPAATRTISAVNTVADVYTISARDANNCLSLPSNGISVLINANPQPTIDPAGTLGTISLCLNGQPTASQVLTAVTPFGSPSATYQWQQLVSGVYNTVGTGNTYTATVASASGQSTKTYRVIATYSNSCTRNSANRTVKVQAGCKDGNDKGNADEIIEINTDSDVVVAYPNPTSGILNIEIENSQATEGKLVLINALGQIVMEQNISIENGKAFQTFDVSNLAIGVYTLSFQTADGQNVQKVVKE